MSIFDGGMQDGTRRPKKVKSGKAIVSKKRRLVYKQETPKISRNERRRVTEAYERGEIKFEDTSAAFLLCHCNQSPDFHSYPHNPHTDELARFELEHYGKKHKV